MTRFWDPLFFCYDLVASDHALCSAPYIRRYHLNAGCELIEWKHPFSGRFPSCFSTFFDKPVMFGFISHKALGRFFFIIIIIVTWFWCFLRLVLMELEWLCRELKLFSVLTFFVVFCIVGLQLACIVCFF